MIRGTLLIPHSVVCKDVVRDQIVFRQSDAVVRVGAEEDRKAVRHIYAFTFIALHMHKEIDGSLDR